MKRLINGLFPSHFVTSIVSFSLEQFRFFFFFYYFCPAMIELRTSDWLRSSCFPVMFQGFMVSTSRPLGKRKHFSFKICIQIPLKQSALFLILRVQRKKTNQALLLIPRNLKCVFHKMNLDFKKCWRTLQISLLFSRKSIKKGLFRNSKLFLWRWNSPFNSPTQSFFFFASRFSGLCLNLRKIHCTCSESFAQSTTLYPCHRNASVHPNNA